MSTKSRILVLGGARSGKSRFAREWCETRHGQNGQKTFIATCPPLDDEMKERISLHRSERGEGWETVEEYFHLGETLRKRELEQGVVLVDCLTLWLSNLMTLEKEKSGFKDEIESFKRAVEDFSRPLAMVSSEVGLGLVPADPLGRIFRDWQGKLNQEIARIADEVYLVTAGIPLRIK